MQNIKKFLTQYKWYILLFILFLEIAIFTPLCGDDWGNYINFKSIMAIVNYSKSFYYSWEGRVVSRFLIGLLTYNKLFWNILLPCLMVTLIYYINKFSNSENKCNIFLLSILSILLINNVMFAQTYTWIAGSITYLYPTVLVFCYFIYIFSDKNKENIINFIILIFINIIGTMFVENIGAALVFGNLLYIIYYYLINKKITIKGIILFLISTIGLIIMLKSPGSEYRLATNIEFNSMSFFEKISYNKYFIMQYLYERNIFVILLMTIPIVLIVFKRINNKKIRYILTPLFLIIPIITIINNFVLFIPLEIKLKPFDISSNYLFLIYWILFTILYLISIILSNLNKKDKLKTTFLLFIGLSSMMAISVTPGFSDRVAYFSLVILITVSLKLINSLNLLNGKKLNIILKIVLIIVMLYYLLAFLFIGIYNSKREAYIKQCVEAGDENIVIKSNPIYLIWNNNPSNEYHMETFKNYYKIPKNVDVSIAWIRF